MFESIKQAYLPDTNFPKRVIDGEKCIRCGRCYEACPTNGYSWSKGEVPTPHGFGGIKQACFNCGNCTVVCPTGAISVVGNYSVDAGRYKTRLTKNIHFPDPLKLNETKSYDEFRADLTEVENTIYTRRSIRLFKNKEVPRDLIERILEAGRFAPSAGNCQPYKFIVISNFEIINELEQKTVGPIKLLKNLYLNKGEQKPLWKKIIFTILSLLMVNKLDPRPMTAMEKADKNNGHMYFNPPSIILVLKNTRGVSNPDLDAGICCQNMVLTAHSLGLGTCYISLPIEILNSVLMTEFRRKIGMKPPFKAVTSIAIGYPQGKIDKIVARDTPEVVWLN